VRDLVVRGVAIPAEELTWRFTGSGGPGGQHANTSNTSVEVRFDVAGSPSLDERARARVRRRLAGRLTGSGELVVTSSATRSQHRNREDALARLVALLDEGLRPPAAPRRPTAPSRAARQRRLDAKRRHGELKAGRQRRDW
jgi:ribosome-associated protein